MNKNKELGMIINHNLLKLAKKLEDYDFVRAVSPLEVDKLEIKEDELLVYNGFDLKEAEVIIVSDLEKPQGYQLFKLKEKNDNHEEWAKEMKKLLRKMEDLVNKTKLEDKWVVIARLNDNKTLETYEPDTKEHAIKLKDILWATGKYINVEARLESAKLPF